IPIFSGEDVVAVLTVGRDVRRGFDRGQVITLETLADGIGIILRNAELYQALERTNAKLVELDRMKSELVNIVAHDFRSPLAGVLGHAELLEWKPDASRGERVEQAQAIIRAATHMASLVDKTLKTTRLETGHFPFEFGVVELGAVARAVVSRGAGRGGAGGEVGGRGRAPGAGARRGRGGRARARCGRAPRPPAPGPGVLWRRGARPGGARAGGARGGRAQGARLRTAGSAR